MAEALPFRFGIHLWQLPVADWRAKAQRYEELGFSTMTFTDHVVVPQWDPFAGLAAVAAVTDRLRVGTLVVDTGVRNPVLVAKAAATISLLSGGRFQLGLGAGYVAANFSAVGLPFDPPGQRLARLEEAVTVMRRLWSQPSTTVHGRFVDVTDCPMVAPEPVKIPLLIGGGGPRAVSLAGRMADIVSVIPRQSSGEWSLPDSMVDSTAARMAEKTEWARRAAADAGRDPAGLEFNTMVFRVIVGDDVDQRRGAEQRDSGVTAAQIGDSSLYLCGTGPEVRAHLCDWRARTGISYFSLFDPGDDQIEYLAEHVVKPLTGT